MSFVVFWSIAIMTLLAFALTKRRIHLFEGIIMWSVFMMVQNSFMWTLSMNLKLVKLTENRMGFLANDSIRSVIIPIFMLFFLERYSSCGRIWGKFIYFAGIVIALVGIEQLAKELSVIRYLDGWGIEYSIACWAAQVLLYLAVFKLVRHFSVKDVRI